MSVVAAIRQMIAGGLSVDQALLAAEIMEAREAPQLTSRQARNQRYYEARKRLNSDVSDAFLDAASEIKTPKTPKTVGPKKVPDGSPKKKQNPSFTPKPSLDKSSSGVVRADAKPLSTDEGATPKTVIDVLKAGLGEKLAWAVFEHRKAMGHKLTVYAAELLVGKLTEWPNLKEAVDTMIAKNWRGFEVEWMNNIRGDRRGPAPPRERPMTNIERMKAELAEEIAENEREERQGGPQGAGAENGGGVPGFAVAVNGRAGR